MTSTTLGERIKWAISGEFEYRSTLFKPNREVKGRELQYEIDPPPQVNNKLNITLTNITTPVFSWDIHFRRLLMPYIFKTFIPMTTLVMTSWISFLIPPNVVPGRSGLLVTLLLVLTTFHLHELDRSPLISSVTPLLIWTEICLAFVLIAFVQYSFILYFTRFDKERKQNYKIRAAINPIYSIVQQRQGKEVRNSGKSNEKQGEVTNLTLRNQEDKGHEDDSFNIKTATMIDYYALMVVPIGFLLVVFSYFIYFSI